MTELQQQVCNVAREQLQEKPWFRGLCTDEMPSDEEILAAGIAGAAAGIAFQTAYWDAPDVFNP